MKKKIAIIITTGFTKFGGLTGVVMNCLRNMDTTECEIHIISGNTPEEELLNECERLGIQYKMIPERNKNTIIYMFRLANYLKGYDVVHIHSNSATALVELLCAKISGVGTRIVQNHTAKCDHYVANALCKPFFRILYTECIACSRKAGDWLFGSGNYMVLNNTIDTEKFRFNVLWRDKIRKEYEIQDDTICIGHVGKIYQPKNHKFLIEVFKEYHGQNSNSKLLIVGDGVMRNEIEQYVDYLGLGDNVIFAGMKSNVNEFLSAFDVFAFPSLWEGMPLSVLEAQASGLPCYLSDTIDNDISITPLVSMLPIDCGTVPWVTALQERKEINRLSVSNESITHLKDAYYDSSICANELRRMYLQSK